MAGDYLILKMEKVNWENFIVISLQIQRPLEGFVRE